MTEPYDIVCDSADRDAWMKYRLTGIGASEIAAVLGESHWSAAIKLYAEKTGHEQDAEETEAQFWGLRLERIIANVFAERTGRTVIWSGLCLRSKEHPWALATLDANNYVGNYDPIPLDAKTATVWKSDEWSDGAPRQYYLQAQQQMLVTGAKRATMACLLGGQKLVWCDIERDETDIRKIIYAGERFWDLCIGQGIPPAPDGSSSADTALLQLYPSCNGNIVKLGAEYDEMYRQLKELKAAAKDCAGTIDLLEQRFKAAIGTATTALLPSGNRVVWGQRDGCISWKKVAESLGASPAVAEQFRGKPTRVFNLREARD